LFFAQTKLIIGLAANVARHELHMHRFYSLSEICHSRA